MCNLSEVDCSVSKERSRDGGGCLDWVVAILDTRAKRDLRAWCVRTARRHRPSHHDCSHVLLQVPLPQRSAFVMFSETNTKYTSRAPTTETRCGAQAVGCWATYCHKGMQ